MTTIAYKSGILVSDSQASSQGSVCNRLCKVFKLDSGSLIGFSGDVYWKELINLFNPVLSPNDFPAYDALKALDYDVGILYVFPNGSIYEIGLSGNNATDASTFVWEVQPEFASVGSGSSYAVAAMKAGASARRAVEIACFFDTRSGLPLHQVKL